MKNKKKEDPISRRIFITDTGKTLFYTAMAASVIPAFIATSCSKDSGTDPQNTKLVSSDDGLKQACTHGYQCFDDYDCGGKKGRGSFNCNHGFQCDSEFDCNGPNFHCHDVYTMHKGGHGG